jgi:hypothetical protein
VILKRINNPKRIIWTMDAALLKVKGLIDEFLSKDNKSIEDKNKIHDEIAKIIGYSIEIERSYHCQMAKIL